MFKKLIDSFQKTISSDKGNEKINRNKKIISAKSAWGGTARRVDAAIPRRRALSSSIGNVGKKIVATVGRGRLDIDKKKDTARKMNPIKHWKVFSLDEKVHLLYEKEKKFFIKNLESSTYSLKGDKEISLVNNFSYDVDFSAISEINISQLGKGLILNYKRDSDYKEKVTSFATLSGGSEFREVSSSKEIKNKFIFAKKDISQGKYWAYTGENFIYLASSDSLKKWDISREYVLTPRQNFFDADGLRIIESIELKEGILLLYETSFTKENISYLQVGGALFDKKSPEKLLWRSASPIWEQSFELKEIRAVLALGVSLKKNRLFVYYSINDELLTVDFAIPKFISRKEKVTLVTRHPSNPIITPNPNNKWESKAVFNAAAIHAGGKYHLIYRAIGEDDVSSLGYACSEDGFDFDTRLGFPVYVPREKFEGVHGRPYLPCTDPAVYESGGGCCGGCEDPRITRVRDTIYMTYVAYNGHDVPGVAITSIKYEDFINQRWNWEKARLISKPGEIQKNWVLFPEKINGKYALIHGLSPKVHIEYVKNFEDMDGKGYIDSLPSAHGKGFQDPSRLNHWDNIVRGTGAPPLKTKYGWLVFYHAMDRRDPNRYKIGAMILDLKNPEKILYRSRVPLLEPDAHYENEGMKAGVVYVCGAIIEKDMIHIYYGGADMVMCVATSKLDDFLEELIQDEKSDLKKVNS